MAQNGKGTIGTSTTMARGRKPRSSPIAAKGVKTGRDFADFMSALMSDLIEGRVSPMVGNAACNAGGKLLKVVEMEYRYATKNGEAAEKPTLKLAS